MLNFLSAMAANNAIELFFIQGAGGLNWLGQVVRWIIEHYDLKFHESQPSEKAKIDVSDNMQDNLL